MLNVDKGERQSILNRWLQVPWLAILLGFLVLGAILSISEPAFSSWTNYRNILLQSVFTAIIAVGMTFVIMSGGIDISVGMNVFLMMSVMYLLGKYGVPAWIVLIAGVLGATCVGVFNGFLICVLGIVPMIATLSTLSICRGISYIIIESKMKVVAAPIRVVGMARIGNVPLPILIMILVAVVGWILLKYTRFGRYVLAVGNSTISAHESGIGINKVRFATYAFCGFCTGIAAIIYIGRLGTVQTDSGYGIEFTVITAVVLGGTKLSGGRGNITGSVIGCLFLTLIENGLSLMEVSGFYYDVVRGAILFLAVIIEAISTKRQNLAQAHQRTLRLGVKVK